MFSLSLSPDDVIFCSIVTDVACSNFKNCGNGFRSFEYLDYLFFYTYFFLVIQSPDDHKMYRESSEDPVLIGPNDHVMDDVLTAWILPRSHKNKCRFGRCRRWPRWCSADVVFVVGRALGCIHLLLTAHIHISPNFLWTATETGTSDPCVSPSTFRFIPTTLDTFSTVRGEEGQELEGRSYDGQWLFWGISFRDVRRFQCVWCYVNLKCIFTYMGLDLGIDASSMRKRVVGRKHEWWKNATRYLSHVTWLNYSGKVEINWKF